MEVIQIETKSRTYPVYIGSGIVNELPQFINENCKSVSKVLVITDENVSNFYLEKLMKILSDKYQTVSYTVPASEHAKSFDVYYDCQTYALSQGLDRSSLILAFGGGVVGDLAGFVAATFMRGIPFIQIPTTLLAHDSAVGGKVAINHEQGKNMIGSFHQPNAVVYDIDFIKTLPIKELRSGFAEVVKHALIWDAQFFEWISNEITSLDDLVGEKLQYAIKKGISVKAEVVSQDEQENGIRAILNFGHTLGHAIEAELGYGQITHGDGVIIGMIFAMKVSEEYFDGEPISSNIQEWLSTYTFPTTIPKSLQLEQLLSRMKKDKKSAHGAIRMVLHKKIGEVEVVEVDDAKIIEILNRELSY